MRILKEPLLHFLLMGAVIFGLHAWRQRGAEDGAAGGDRRIEVNASTITRLKEGWTRQFQRTPDEHDLRGLVEAHVREEVLFREALKLGLDRNDTIVRRRLAQKMEFLTQDIATAGTPDEAALEKYFADHRDRYAKPQRLSFRHVYFSREKRPDRAEAEARAALEALAAPGADEAAFGDGFLAGFEFEAQEEREIAAIFGAEFAAAVAMLETGGWSGPLGSSYGAHLVLVTAREAPRPAEFATVREAVLRDLLEDRRRAANDAVLARMMADYEIAIDQAALDAAAPDPLQTAQAKP
jgi:parvulin-like peptidyl-prolyl isomerase